MNPGAFALRAYTAGDEAAAIELWRKTWQVAYPHIDFAARLAWWSERWRRELVPACTIMVAEAEAEPGGRREILGFVTVDPRSGYLDQIVVAPEAWGSQVAAALISAAKEIAPSGLVLHVNRDNRRAIRFYEKHGFGITGEDSNPLSGAAVYRMNWPSEAVIARR